MLTPGRRVNPRSAGSGLAITHHSLAQTGAAPWRFVRNATGAFRGRLHEWVDQLMLELEHAQVGDGDEVAARLESPVGRHVPASRARHAPFTSAEANGLTGGCLSLGYSWLPDMTS